MSVPWTGGFVFRADLVWQVTQEEVPKKDLASNTFG